MSNTISQLDYSSYISSFRAHLKQLFREEYDFNALSLNRDLPADFLAKIMEKKPLSVAIPEIHGGRGVHVKECLGVLSAASYESLALSLMFGINIALFLEPLAKYSNFPVQDRIFKQFLENNAMGGLMITEKAYGSDALNMKTSYQQLADTYKVKGEKHWQGLSGAADFWLVTARKQAENGDLSRDIDFFVTDNSKADQHIPMVERYDNLGLYAIPYGVNVIDIEVPAEQKLTPESTGIKLMLDMLHRSRLQFPGMGLGFIKRLLDESLQHCQQRIVSGSPLINIDSVKYQLARLQAAFTINSGMCAFSVKSSGIEHDLATMSIEANSLKALVTDLMQESAQISLQLAGANGYRLNHLAGRAVVDSRPFQIFEGSNEMLYSQIAEGILKLMKKAKETSLLAFFKSYSRTNIAFDYFKSQIDFNLDGGLNQRDLVTLGRMFARIICFQFVLEMEGFNAELVEITRQHMLMDLTMLNGQFLSKNHANPVVDYEENADWMSFVS
ncbi:acyl-CoA dehydrogenase [Sphingobacterium sp. DK4209]|uniref:Acyl-CoA dehydrogenase n=1 Tax=Sphingobacterium zhuxiongii TaxID=2662364 RepID=A0A5Q0QGG4_9SPHI|nr:MULTISPECIES: acyl-CoA dehydrogenase family protein [unclassified Sphingobacterium]MVZ64670.1 acyl-CoA dehydrogenase [Sphingobacterium sp. DK4209]QGA27008.1 acyl-CoA dehydrogenase [Sphingobacterium sp. dk4302]